LLRCFGSNRQIVNFYFLRYLGIFVLLEFLGIFVKITIFRLTKTHEEYKDKKFEIELSWITDANNHTHLKVPKELRVKF